MAKQQIIDQFHLPLEIGWHNKKINTESLSGGIYIFKVQKQSGSIAREVIITK